MRKFRVRTGVAASELVLADLVTQEEGILTFYRYIMDGDVQTGDRQSAQFRGWRSWQEVFEEESFFEEES